MQRELAAIQLNRLELLLTAQCTGRCAHCLVRAGPGRRQAMTLAGVEAVLASTEGQPLEWILLSGGEPFLVPDLLRAAVRLAARRARTLVATNGHWATDPETARRRLGALQEAGLDLVRFSVDAFHQAHVPLERVAAGVEAARGLGVGVEVAACFLGGVDAPNSFNQRTRDDLARLGELCNLAGVPVARERVRLVGRAAEGLSPFLPTRAGPHPACPLPGVAAGEPGATGAVQVHPGGSVTLCPGLALGNVQQRPLHEILTASEPEKHAILNALTLDGPDGLRRLAREEGFSAAGGSADGCHLCYQARRFLRESHAAALAPARAYENEAATVVLQLQPGITYGPVHSRRLGRSLGVNLLPTDRKLCSFDCVYCHYGRTEGTTLSAKGGRLPGEAEVLAAVERALRAHPDLAYITFSGNGEPTLHPRFPGIAAGVRRLRDEIQPGAKLALLSNATTVHRPRVRAALAHFDAPILKLDAADAETFRAVNHPAPGVDLERIVKGLEGIPNLVVQCVLVDGRVSNARGAPFEAWLAALARIAPARVQIYSTDRPVPDAGVERVPPEELRRLKMEIEGRTGVPVTAYWA